MIQIETERLVLRPFTDSDAAAIYEITNRPRVAYFLSDMVLADAAGGLEWVRMINGKLSRAEPFIVLAVEEKGSGNCIGLIGVATKEAIGEVEILYGLADEYHNRGYITEAGKALTSWVFANTDALSLAVLVKPDNAASARVAKKLGFIMDGTREFLYDGKQTLFHYGRLEKPTGWEPMEEMASFFDRRADTYESHILDDLEAAPLYEGLTECVNFDTPRPCLLDLGCGTGLELDGLYARFPDLMVTGIDMSAGMLSKLKAKFHDKELKLMQDSYFDVELGEDCYDAAISAYSLHHFTREEKLSLYRKVYRALKPGGSFLNGDYTAKTMEMQLFHLAEKERLCAANGITEGFFHYDTPFTEEYESSILKDAGFANIRTAMRWENTTIMIGVKL